MASGPMLPLWTHPDALPHYCHRDPKYYHSQILARWVLVSETGDVSSLLHSHLGETKTSQIQKIGETKPSKIQIIFGKTSKTKSF